MNWNHGDDVIIVPAVSHDKALKKYLSGWKAPKPYLRIVPQPKQGSLTHGFSRAIQHGAQANYGSKAVAQIETQSVAFFGN